jgi:hypothetical protein
MQLMNKKYFSLAVLILLAGVTNAQEATKAASEPVSLSCFNRCKRCIIGIPFLIVEHSYKRYQRFKKYR